MNGDSWGDFLCFSQMASTSRPAQPDLGHVLVRQRIIADATARPKAHLARVVTCFEWVAKRDWHRSTASAGGAQRSEWNQIVLSYVQRDVLAPYDFHDRDEIEEPAKDAGFGRMNTVRTSCFLY